MLRGQNPDSNYVKEIDSLSLQNKIQCSKAQYQEAIKSITQAEQICLKHLGDFNSKYAYTLFLHGRTQYLFGYLKDADSLYQKALQIQKKDPGINHPDYAWTLNNLGGLNWKLGRYLEAEKYYLEACERRKAILGDLHPDYAWSLHNLAILYVDMGNFEQAESLYLQAMKIRESNPGKLSVDYAYSLNHLALLYTHLANYKKSEKLHLQALQLFNSIYKEAHPNIAWVTGNLSDLYELLGNYETAQDYAEQTISIRKQIFGSENPDYAFALSALGRIYQHERKFAEADSAFQEAKRIRENVYGKRSSDEVKNLQNLASLYKDMGDVAKSEKYWMEAYHLMDSLKWVDPLGHIDILMSLGNFYLSIKQTSKSEIFYVEAKKQVLVNFGNLHPKYADVLDALMEINILKKDYPLASSCGRESFTIHKNQLIAARSYMSDHELELYEQNFLYKQNLDYYLAANYSEYNDIALNVALFYKSFLLQHSLNRQLLSLKDSTNRLLINELKQTQRALGREMEKPLNSRADIRTLQNKVSNIEKYLADKISLIDESKNTYDWKDIRSKLKQKEAALEFVEYTGITDADSNEVYYAALLVHSGSANIQFIPLSRESQWRDLILSGSIKKIDYVNSLYSMNERGAVQVLPGKRNLYELLWLPIEKYLQGVETIYYSCAGLLYRINLDAIPIKESESLGDKYHLIYVQSTRQLLNSKDFTSLSSTAVLFGGIEFNMDSTLLNQNNNIEQRNMFNQTNSSNEFMNRMESWQTLPGTLKEVQSIEKILYTSGSKTQLLSGTMATEESLKKLGCAECISPKIIHIASHGFFFPDDERENIKYHHNVEPIFKESPLPLMRSGLILAGGNSGWQGQINSDAMEDGVLTAMEISQLNLTNTELVVLSACETGLGDIQGNEGVYGLQRAFKIAGVKYIIMSLWQVPDKQTSLLMTTFYKKWLENKMTITDSFRAAQKELRDIGLDPYQWAGFVLVE